MMTFFNVPKDYFRASSKLLRTKYCLFGGGLCKARHGGVHEPRPQKMIYFILIY
jgi:hypothetical protein